MLGCWHRVLVSERGFGARVGFGHPVGGADEGGFGVDVVGALLLAACDCGFVDCGGACEAVCCEVEGGGGVCGVGAGVCDGISIRLCGKDGRLKAAWEGTYSSARFWRYRRC